MSMNFNSDITMQRSTQGVPTINNSSLDTNPVELPHETHANIAGSSDMFDIFHCKDILAPNIECNNELDPDIATTHISHCIDNLTLRPDNEISCCAATGYNQTIQRPLQSTILSVVPILSITNQPSKYYRFCLETEIKNNCHRYLKGIDSVRRNYGTFPTVELHVPYSEDEKYFIRCTLHHPAENKNEVAFVTPYKLCHREGKYFTQEGQLFPMVPFNNQYQFQLEHFFIMHPVQKNYLSICKEKCYLFNKLNSSKLHVRMPHDTMEFKESQVQIGFETFKLMPNGSYVHVAGPIFSNCITDSEPLKITKICNLCGNVNGGTEVTLLVQGYKSSMDISVEINDMYGWHRSVEITKDMWYSNAAITFRTPKYKNEKNDKTTNIECEIRLKLKKNNVLSDAKRFTYIRSLKRTIDENNEIGDYDKAIKVKRPQTPNVEDESISVKSLEEYETDSVAIANYESNEMNMATEKYSTHNIPIKEATPNYFLKITLQRICNLYKEAGKVCIERRTEYSKAVRQHFEYYKHKSAHHNSILHDILQGDEYQSYELYEMKLYKILQCFDLNDLVRDARNIYNNTTLMYACIFDKPQLIRALINMECPIQVQDSDDGNNVLHIISQHQTAEECRKNVIATMKRTHNSTIINYFIRALKDYNLSGLIPLHVAVMFDNVKLVAEFLRFCKKNDSLDVIVYGKRSDGNTILHQAVINKSSQMVSCILKYIPDRSYLNSQNYCGNTAAEINRNMEKPLTILLQS